MIFLYEKKEPDDVNDFTKGLAHILNFESFYCPYYIFLLLTVLPSWYVTVG